MKKSLAILGLSLILAGCSSKSQSPQQQATDSPPDSAQMMAQFDTISTAIKNNDPIKCVMTNDNTKATINYVVKGKKMAMMGTNLGEQNQNGKMIFDGTYLYTWTSGNTEGVKMKMPEKTDMEQANSTDPLPDFSKKEMWENYQKTGFVINCEKTSADDSLFIPPTDVTFTDMSAMMEQLQKKMNTTNQQAPDTEQGMRTMPAPGQE